MSTMNKVTSISLSLSRMSFTAPALSHEPGCLCGLHRTSVRAHRLKQCLIIRIIQAYGCCGILSKVKEVPLSNLIIF